MRLFYKLMVILPFGILTSCSSSTDHRMEQTNSTIKTHKDHLMLDTLSKITATSKKTYTEKEILDRIVGRYVYQEIRTNSILELNLVVKKNQLKYQIKTTKRNCTGLAKLSMEEDGQIFIFFPIEYDEYEGDLTSGNDKKSISEKPKEICMSFNPKLCIIGFQNYGNAMNYYVILNEFGDDKYIELRKR